MAGSLGVVAAAVVMTASIAVVLARIQENNYRIRMLATGSCSEYMVMVAAVVAGVETSFVGCKGLVTEQES